MIFKVVGRAVKRCTPRAVQVVARKEGYRASIKLAEMKDPVLVGEFLTRDEAEAAAAAEMAGYRGELSGRGT